MQIFSLYLEIIFEGRRKKVPAVCTLCVFVFCVLVRLGEFNLIQASKMMQCQF